MYVYMYTVYMYIYITYIYISHIYIYIDVVHYTFTCIYTHSIYINTAGARGFAKYTGIYKNHNT